MSDHVPSYSTFSFFNHEDTKFKCSLGTTHADAYLEFDVSGKVQGMG
jgi:hypothetical protein